MHDIQKIGFYGGSFDPFTLGHLDIVKQAIEIFDKVVIVVSKNESKGVRWLSLENSIKAIELTIKKAFPLNNHKVSVVALEHNEALATKCVQYCSFNDKFTLIRGVRDGNDLALEKLLATVNRDIFKANTIMFLPNNNVSHISSTMVREVGRLGGDIKHLIPQSVSNFITYENKGSEKL